MKLDGSSRVYAGGCVIVICCSLLAPAVQNMDIGLHPLRVYGMRKWYAVHGVRYTVCGMRYEV